MHASLLVDGQLGTCLVPAQYWGDYYSIEQGIELNTLINNDELTNEQFQGRCYDILKDNTTVDAQGNYDSKVLFYSRYDNLLA